MQPETLWIDAFTKAAEAPPPVLLDEPTTKEDIQELIGAYEDLLEIYRNQKEAVLSSLSARINLFDAPLVTELVMVTRYGNAIVETKIKLNHLKNLLYRYCPPKSMGGFGVNEAEIARAKEYPIGNLVEVKRKKALCPFHTEKTPSLYVYADNHAYCFGACSRAYDSIDICMLIRNLPFTDAVRYLNDL